VFGTRRDQDRDMVAALGVNQKAVHQRVRHSGFSRQLGGALQIPRDAVHHGGLRIIVDVFGGGDRRLGSIIGAFVAAGWCRAHAFGILISEDLHHLVFLVMAAVLIVRHGACSEAEARAARRVTVILASADIWRTEWRRLCMLVRRPAVGAALAPRRLGDCDLRDLCPTCIPDVVGGLASFGHPPIGSAPMASRSSQARKAPDDVSLRSARAGFAARPYGSSRQCRRVFRDATLLRQASVDRLHGSR